ncbi:hypothetical protein [Achromobacter animicus]|uniref:hypothetical protein n=1 Tax=Achromobacter animicus TaxID=1389935 RepID=UPI002448A408|nr:hypothetical protein [Achromobacter animicus]MDH0683866.1 hypothetical protein [Achromobacter animicus]
MWSRIQEGVSRHLLAESRYRASAAGFFAFARIVFTGSAMQEARCKKCIAGSALARSALQEAPRIGPPPVVCHVVDRPAIYYRPMKTQACLVLIMVRADPIWCIFFILPDAITK